jgi:monoamine oxidase
MSRLLKSGDVIAGTGFAGLEAALRAPAGSVDVFEYFDMPGGRTQLAQDPLCPIPDKAASFVHGDRLRELAAEAGVPVESLDSMSCFFSNQGRVDRLEIQQSAWAAMEYLTEFAGAADRNCSIAEALLPLPDNGDIHPDLLLVSKKLIEADTGASLDEIGTTSLLVPSTAADAGAGSLGVVLKGGIGSIAQHMYKKAQTKLGSDRFHFKQALSAIHYGGGSLLLDFRSINRNSSHVGSVECVRVEAHSAFLTLPVPHLRKLLQNTQASDAGLTPVAEAIGKDTRRALDLIQMGTATKVVFETSRQLVDSDALPAHVAVNDPLCQSVWIFPKDGKQVVLMYLGGPSAEVVAQKSDQELATWVNDYLEQHFSQKNIPSQSPLYMFPWTQNASSGGAYSYITPDGSEDSFEPRRVLSQPLCDNQLFIGGEAASPKYGSYVAGALDSVETWISHLKSR